MSPMAQTQPGVEPLEALQASPSQETEAYGLLDEYVDDLLGIPQKDRPVSWSRPSWQETAASMPKMVLEDGSRGPALGSLPPKQRLQDPDLASSSREPLQPATCLSLNKPLFFIASISGM